jgi:hypothetical protein
MTVIKPSPSTGGCEKEGETPTRFSCRGVSFFLPVYSRMFYLTPTTSLTFSVSGFSSFALLR